MDGATACRDERERAASSEAVIAFKIKLESPGPVIYRQCRVGKDRRLFNVYKFRTMRTDAEASGAQWAHEDDPRVTRFGRFKPVPCNGFPI